MTLKTTLLVWELMVINAPPNSLKDSNANPKVKTIEGVGYAP
jgi:hypothetical protein